MEQECGGAGIHLSDVWLEGLEEIFLVLLLLYSHSWRIIMFKNALKSLSQEVTWSCEVSGG